MSIEFNHQNGLYLPSQDVKQNPIYLSQVDAIHASESQTLTNENIAEKVEKPLVEAVRILNFKNIPTFTSGANGENGVGDCAGVTINFTKLSKPNQMIAQKLVAQGLAVLGRSYRGDFGVEPLTLELKGEEGVPLAYNKVEKYFIELADKFIQQKKEDKVQIKNEEKTWIYTPELQLELPSWDVEEATSRWLNYDSVEEMYKKLTVEEVKSEIQKVRDMFHWDENPLIGKEK
jgi:hypothetical protein